MPALKDPFKQQKVALCRPVLLLNIWRRGIDAVLALLCCCFCCLVRPSFRSQVAGQACTLHNTSFQCLLLRCYNLPVIISGQIGAVHKHSFRVGQLPVPLCIGVKTSHHITDREYL